MKRLKHSLRLFAVASLVACQPDGEFFLPAERLRIPVVRLPNQAELPPKISRSGRGPAMRALFDLAVQVDLEALGVRLKERGAGKLERRRVVIAALQEVAARTQGRLEPFLEELRRGGKLRSYRGFSVRNRLLVEATPEGLRALTRRPEVAAIVAETESEEAVWAGDPASSAPAGRTSWAIASLGADAAWRQGLDGTGVVVGILDSGASAAHEQLRESYRGAELGWHDPAGSSPEPRDGAFGHATGVLSCAVGSNLGEVTLGIAPGAAWAACAALPDGRYNNVLMTECADWMLATAQPDVLINAWSLPAAGCDLSFQPIVDAWRAAEILPIFAAGNLGPLPGSDRSPANYVNLYPGESTAFSVGGLTESEEVFARSSRGPNSCDRTAVYPAVVAPAEEVVAAMPLTATTYRQAEGTSFAAGFAAGVAALLLQRHPDASVVELEQALRAGAVDLGDPGPDDRFGHGRLDVPRSLAALGRLREARTAVDGGWQRASRHRISPEIGSSISANSGSSVSIFRAPSITPRRARPRWMRR